MTAPRLNMRRKIACILVVTLLCFVAVIFKLFVLQILQGDELQAKAEDMRTRSVTVSASRGTLYDSLGNKLALSITADSIGAYPAEVKSSNKALSIAKTLAGILDIDAETIYTKITSDNSFVWIKRKVDFEAADMIKFENLPGIEIVEETQRFYPMGTLASHVLGFAGIDNQGLEGIELSMDDVLKGTDGSITGKFDANNNAIPQAESEYIEPEDGYDVYLTLDSTIQYYCERALADLMASDTPPKRAGVIVMNPNDCKILAMAMSDPYDPNDFAASDSSSWRNWLISDAYEPGSTFKTVTVSTALEEGTVNENSTFYDGGSVTLGGSTIHCWSRTPHGQQTLAEAVQNSCNPAFVAIGQTIENKESGLFYKYINAFGFGQTTGIDLSGEATGILQNEENVNIVELATISIGQGIAVTPIQLITAVSAIANGGTLLKPQLIDKVLDGDEVVVETKRTEVRRVISEETAAKVREMMIGVVTNGSGANAAIEGYTIAGKTGTAQKVGASGGYQSGKYVASFVAIVPADDPELVCLVVVDEPSGIFYGSQVAAPLFKIIMTDTLRYLGIAPSEVANDGLDKEDKDKLQTYVPNVVNHDVESARAVLTEHNLTCRVEGDGPLVTSQMPSAGSVADSGTTVIIYTGGISTNSDGTTMVTVPDLTGKRFSEVAKLLSSLSLLLNAQGDGVVSGQSVAAGKVVPAGTTITVTFKEEGSGTITTVAP